MEQEQGAAEVIRMREPIALRLALIGPTLLARFIVTRKSRAKFTAFVSRCRALMLDPETAGCIPNSDADKLIPAWVLAGVSVEIVLTLLVGVPLWVDAGFFSSRCRGNDSVDCYRRDDRLGWNLAVRRLVHSPGPRRNRLTQMDPI